ncbi:MAG: [methyl-Co(III) glycine betaine-specific corrinoid protein]--tetrahydrofolate methyltransferase MtgA, partial [Promethearchaeota archaeon]
MEKLENGQKVANFYGVKVGGSIGERVPVLIGSIFYKGHKIVIDDKKGEFDKKSAEREINGFLEFSDKTGIPVIIDVVGGFKESLVKYCEYVGENTDLPFLLDGMNDTARLYAIEKILEQGYQDRVIYNSIEPNITEETMAKLSDLKLKNAVILCFGAGALTPKKKLSLLKGKEGKEGLLSKVERIGIEN